MVSTPSTMMPLGSRAPEFSLPDTLGNTISLSDFTGAKALLVMFICNHCPYVKHVHAEIAAIGETYQEKGVGVVAIMSNDADKYPEDAPEKMAQELLDAGYTFPYLYDADQTTAKAFGAACTPDFFLFDRELRLAYRGRLDGSRPGNGLPVTGADLRAALDALLSGRPVPEPQLPSMGCNIKWKPGNEPGYFAV
ncbi:MAG TPA: thioredoxin family protein [Candidatus Hydrogenedentes bacterium]|nr:thioredoxin family protein [Candidatus Hydrogenedentota bacterium]